MDLKYDKEIYDNETFKNNFKKELASILGINSRFIQIDSVKEGIFFWLDIFFF